MDELVRNILIVAVYFGFAVLLSLVILLIT